MKLEKAKKVLKQDREDHDSVDIVELYDAEQLGIEAIRFFEKCRHGGCVYSLKPLPGETQE